MVAECGYEATSVADIVKRAAVSRNAFYKNFKDKQECFAAAHEVYHGRLLQSLTKSCAVELTLAQRVERALGATFDFLASEPDVARLLFVEASSSAGEEIALSYHGWLRRYGELLRSADPVARPQSAATMEFDQVIVGGIASRIASEVLQGETSKLADLTPQLVEYVLAFYGPAQPGPTTGKVVALEPEPATEYDEARRKRVSA